MELMRDLGLEDIIRQTAPPPEEWEHFRYCESITGPDLAVVDHFTGTEAARSLIEHSPTLGISHLSQPKLERIIYQRIVDQPFPDTGILYNQKVTGVAQGNGVVRVEIESNDGSTSQLECSDLIAADGATGGIREQLGIGLSGKFNLQHFISVHFTCHGLAEKLKNRPAMLYFVFNYQCVAVLVAHNIEEGVWNLQYPYYPPHQTEKDFPEPVIEELLSSCVGQRLGAQNGGSTSLTRILFTRIIRIHALCYLYLLYLLFIYTVPDPDPDHRVCR